MQSDFANEELAAFRESVRRFVKEKIAPHYDDWERNEIMPREVWNQLGEQGFLCVDIPEEFGGCGAPFRFSLVVTEELQRANCGSLASAVTVHSDIVAHYFVNNGTAEQKLRYLPKMASGEYVGAVAMTEPGAGSDLQGIRTFARREGDEFVINGNKTFITNGQLCDFVVTAARTDNTVLGSKGTTLFVVDCDSDGFSRGRNLEKIGQHAADTSELFFQDVRVSEHSVLGEVDRGFSVLMGELQRERLALAVVAVSSAEGVLSETIDYTRGRKAFGDAISNFQNTRFKIAEMATEVRINRTFIEACIIDFTRGSLDVATVSMAKLAATEMLNRVVDGCLQLHGGYGYMREYGVSRAFVDARIHRIYGGTSEIMKELIGRALLAY